MIKRITRFCVLFGLLTFFIVPVSNAVDPNWEEHQDEMFEKIGLKPGDEIKKDNWEKIDGLVPDDIANWVKEGLIEMTIGEFKIDASLDAEWEEYGKKHNMDKYILDKDGNIIEAATGAFPQSPYGEIFPDIDLKNDPDSKYDVSTDYPQVFKTMKTKLHQWMSQDKQRIWKDEHFIAK